MAEETTTGATAFLLRIAVDYSARDAILAAAHKLNALGTESETGEPPTREAFTRLLAGPLPAPDVDLLVRTGGEKRLSDFLLWECAYAELVFTERMWPDFGEADLAAAVAEFHHRERRFGTVPAAPAPARAGAAARRHRLSARLHPASPLLGMAADRLPLALPDPAEDLGDPFALAGLGLGGADRGGEGGDRRGLEEAFDGELHLEHPADLRHQLHGEERRPPRRKKLSSTPTRSTPRISAKRLATASSKAVRGAR